MCGITGFFSLEKGIDTDQFYRAHTLIGHRGPDDEGFVVFSSGFNDIIQAKGDKTIPHFSALPDIRSLKPASLIMGHHRLSIIDLSPSGHQPMASPDCRFWVVFNGEIFNYIELREDLRSLDWDFQSKSDTEVFLKAYIEWGTESFNKFNGMWAAAIFDSKERCLVLTRDRFGIKPLYYALIDGDIFFGSEAKFLLPFISSLTPDMPSVADYIARCHIDHKEKTLFSGIYQVMPGNWKIYKGKNLEGGIYWDFMPNEATGKKWPQALEEMETLFDSSVDLRLRSDVPVGSLLSGGLDSNSIVCNIHKRHHGNIKDFHLFSAVYEDERFSEKKYIEHTVEMTGFEQHWIYPAPEFIKQELPLIINHMDFPVRSLQIFSQWTIMKNVRGQSPVLVLLNGQGSDEIFGGYSQDYFALYADLLTKARLINFIKEIKYIRAMRSLSLYTILSSVFYHMYAQYRSREGKTINSRCPVIDKSIGHDFILYPYSNGRLFMTHLFNSLHFSALPEYLRYEDRNSMAFGLETRLPFMDYRLVEWAFTLPASYKIKNGVNKRILREYASAFVPTGIIRRKDKQGFVTPQENWQREIMKENMEKELFSMDWRSAFPFLDPNACKEYINNYFSGKNNDWALIWRLYCLLIWHRLWFNPHDD